jgi:hypothetical protein
MGIYEYKYVQSSGTGLLSIGSCVAPAISWDTHHHILWAIMHAFFSWFYVLYFALTR